MYSRSDQRTKLVGGLDLACGPPVENPAIHTIYLRMSLNRFMKFVGRVSLFKISKLTCVDSFIVSDTQCTLSKLISIFSLMTACSRWHPCRSK